MHLPKGMSCTLVDTTSLPEGAMYLHVRKFCTLTDTILYPFAVSLIFNPHRQFLYAGMILIPASMITINASKILEIEKSIYNTIFFYLHAIFYLRLQFL